MGVEPAASGGEYDAIYREHAPKVLALARRRLMGRGVPEDVVQEVFLRAFVAMPTLDMDRPVWPWLRRVTVNVCTDVLRSPRTWAEEPTDVGAESLAALAAAPGVDPVSTLLADEQRQAIVDALDRLAPRQREILLRRVVDGTSSEEMAAGEGTSVEAVKSAVKRGRLGFRQAYKDIASERGLLGGTPPAAVTPDSLLIRLRGLMNACARVCNESPWWQSVPVAVAAAVVALGLGLGAGPDADRADAALPGPGGRGAGVSGEALRVVAAGAVTGSSSATMQPGGGAPPTPPPGQDRGGGREDPLVTATFGPHWEYDDPNDTLFIGVKAKHPSALPGGTGESTVGMGHDMTCERSERHRMSCEAANVLVGLPIDGMEWGHS